MEKPNPNRKASLILLIEGIGFCVIIVLSWLDELLGLPTYLFGSAVTPNWHEAVLESTVTLLAWAVVHRTTRRILTRLHYLEEFLRVCSWCRKVGYDGEWVSLEEYFSRKYNTATSHGMCPECKAKLLGASQVVPAFSR